MPSSVFRSLTKPLLMAACISVVTSLLGCQTGPPGGKALRRTKQRVFVMGFDGMDPTLAKKYMDKDKYPFHKDGDVRVAIKIAPEKVTGM